MRLAPVELEFHYADHLGDRALPDAYERLLLDAIEGDAALFARSDEIERAWELVDPLTSPRETLSYSAGSWGPAAAVDFLAQDGRAWIAGCTGHPHGVV
jgi:glucose-6-phosphate 1-dehydrogenase